MDGLLNIKLKIKPYEILNQESLLCHPLALLLPQEPSYRVLLIEAGGEEPWLSNVPLAAPLMQRSKFDWSYACKPQTHSSGALHDRVGSAAT